ncbi:MAG: DNA polymerase I [Bdellovibrionaceae bacterium]|nr:DNA polymerase I [Pseudobdellovibrionaceae bacterium]
MKKLYLVDVSSMFFRAYYAVRPLSTSKGLPTNAVYGFLSMVVKLLKDIKPDYVAFCFDRPEPSFRKDIYSEYKANRSEMPPDLIPQVPYIKRLTEAIGIPMFEKPGFEADDIIGTLAQLAKEHDIEVVIVSGDKDFAQLINERVTMLDTMKDKIFNPAEVKAKWGVAPEQFIDYLALTGDASDNIPGVRGIGPKGAEKLITEFGSVENIYERIDEVRNENIKKKLLESKDNAFLSKKLVTIAKDMDLVHDLNVLKIHQKDPQLLDTVLDELEFQSFRKNLVFSPSPVQETTASSMIVSPAAATVAPVPASTELNAQDMNAWLKENKRIYIYLKGESFFFSNEKEVQIYAGSVDDIREELLAIDRKWLGFDLKTIWHKLGINTPLLIEWDAMLAAYVLRAGAVTDFFEVQKLYDAGNNVADDASPATIMQALVQLKPILDEKLKDAKMDQIPLTIEYPLVDILLAMETKGVLVDADFLNQESKDLDKELKAVEKKIHEAAGEEFNVASPKQLGNILFEKLNLPKGKKTKTGYSTNSDVLEKLAPEFPIAALITDYRELAKLKSTYVDALPLLINPQTGRVHTQFNQAVTATGRLSSTHPNLQNIPIRTERGLRIRKAFIAAPGKKLISADYSQIELRVLAHITGDKNLTKAFAEDLDIHAATASEIFEVPLNEVGEDLRRKAKAVNFGIAYGQGVYGLSEGLNISRAESKDIIERYFQRFPGVKQYMTDTVELVREKGYVETLLGRRRYIPEIHSKNHALKAFAERAAINAPIQGMSSDMVKMAMIEVREQFRNEMILQVHDELIFEMEDDSKLKEKTQKIKSLMEGCIQLNVPLKVNINTGSSWADL